MKDYYQILDVPPDAPQEKIKEQFRFLVQAWHPDKFPTPAQKAKAEEKTKDIIEANEVLSDPAKRAEYDSTYAPKRDGATGAKPVPPKPSVSPAALDFGSLRHGDKRTIRFVVNNLGGPVKKEINFNFSPNTDPWFKFEMLSKTLPMDVTVSVDTVRLVAGQSYDGWVEVSLDGGTARVPLILRVLSPVTAPRAPKASAASDTATCPNCGHVNAKSKIYCEQCAQPLGSARYCAHCGHAIPAQARYCPACSRKV